MNEGTRQGTLSSLKLSPPNSAGDDVAFAYVSQGDVPRADIRRPTTVYGFTNDYVLILRLKTGDCENGRANYISKDDEKTQLSLFSRNFSPYRPLKPDSVALLRFHQPYGFD